MNQSDALALEKVVEIRNCSSDATEQKILDITDRLLQVFSFSDHQTYPRPSHPLEEKRRDVYFTLVAVLISLRTTLEKETLAMEAFMRKYDSPLSVLEWDEKELAETVRPAWMPSKRAKTIRAATQYYVEVLLPLGWADFLNSLPLDVARAKLMEIPGVGPKAADCILELWLDRASMVIDVNMLRVVSRMFSLPWANVPDPQNAEQIQGTKEYLESHLTKDGFLYQVVHTMLLLHGKHVCRSKPRCAECRFSRNCGYFESVTSSPLEMETG